MIEQHHVTAAETATTVAPSGKCPACGSATCTEFFESRDIPVNVGVFYDTRQAASGAPKGDVRLAFCHGCGLVFNCRFDPSKISYEPGYEVALHHSDTFCRFMEGVVERLVDRFDIRGKNVLEIACGCGYFLRLLCQRGGNHGVGIDPTVAREGTEAIGDGSVRFIRDFFGDRFADIPADFICCLSAFEHIDRPFEFLRTLRNMIGDGKAGVYFEIFNAFDAFRREEIWSIHYEQCNYFSQDSFVGIFRRAGFEIVDSGTCYEGNQYLFIDAVPGDPQIDERDFPLPAEIQQFGHIHDQKLQLWQQRFDEYRRCGRKVVVWGTGGKGITLLNSLDTIGVVEFVVEINPDKQGKFVPGSGQKIVSPNFLAEYQPETVIITNKLYEEEMKRQALEIGVDCHFVVA